MSEKKTKTEKAKSWIDRNRVLTGALAGFAAGSIVPGVGNVVGALGGALIGYGTVKEKEKRE